MAPPLLRPLVETSLLLLQLLLTLLLLIIIISYLLPVKKQTKQFYFSREDIWL